MKVESIQRHFTGKIEGYNDLHYWARLAKLRLMSLQRRRERYIILHLHKILTNTAPNEMKVTFFHNPRRGLCCKVPPLSKSAKTKFQTKYDDSFAVFAPRLWNSLPESIRAEERFTRFKAVLTRHMLSIPDEPPVHGIASSYSILQRAGHHGRLEMS